MVELVGVHHHLWHRAVQILREHYLPGILEIYASRGLLHVPAARPTSPVRCACWSGWLRRATRES